MDRYSRHRNLFTETQLEHIRHASVVVAGAGGLGCTVMQLMVRLGIGTLHVYDYAQVDLPDLNRQILYDERDLGENKAECSVRKLSAINKEVRLFAHVEKIDESTPLPDVDLVFDCLDNFQTRFALDRMLYQRATPMIHGGVNKYFAQVTSIVPGQSKSLSELFPVEAAAVDKELSKDIFPPLVTTTASVQVSEGIKFLTNRQADMLINRVLMIDALTNAFEIVEFK